MLPIKSVIDTGEVAAAAPLQDAGTDPAEEFALVFGGQLALRHVENLKALLAGGTVDEGKVVDAILEAVRDARVKEDVVLDMVRVLQEAARARRLLEERRAAEDKALGKTDETDKGTDRKKPAFSIQKMLTALLKRLGAPTPDVKPDDPHATDLLMDALKKWRSGARRQFTRDSDLNSMPRFPVVRVMGE